MKPEDIDPSEPAVPGVELAGGEATWRKYAGKVIAGARGEVLASGDTWATAIDAAKRAGLSFETVEFMFVPNATVIG